MNDNPGISLFQNSNFDVLKSNTPAPEEIEDEQERMRYDKELGEDLQDAFKDLDDINASVNSSYSVSISECYPSSRKKSRKSNSQLPPFNDSTENYHFKSKDYSSAEQLEVLYNVRLREIEKLRDEKKHLEEQYNKDKSELIATIKQLRLEKENMDMSHNEVQKILVETSSRLSEAERELTSFRQRWSECEQIKCNALHELEMQKITIGELEKRLLAAEKNGYKNEEKNFDNLLRELSSKSKRDIAELQREIHNLNNRIVTKEIDYAKLEQQLIDIQRNHEIVLNEKTKIIDKLNSNLAECHSRNQSLLVDKNSSDVTQLLHELQQKTQEIDAFKREVTKLKEQLTLGKMPSVNELLQTNTSEKARKRSVSPVNRSDVRFKNELQNALDSLKTKQAETEILRQKLFSLSREVQILKNAEAGYVMEIEALETKKGNLFSELAKSQKDLELLKIGLMNYVTKTDILHQEQISELELASSKNLLELEGKMKELEIQIKNDAMKAFTEEVNQITSMYSNHFDKLNVAVEQLRMELEEKILIVRQMDAQIEKFRQETDKIYTKYRNARKMAVTLKQIVEDRTQLLRCHHKQYVQTLNEVQKHLDNALISKTIETDKLAELIEKSTKNTMNMDELLGNDEINSVMLDINKKLMYFE